MAKLKVDIGKDCSVRLYVQADAVTKGLRREFMASSLAARMMDGLRQVMQASGLEPASLCEGSPTEGMSEQWRVREDAFLLINSQESCGIRTAITFLLQGDADKAKRWLLQWVSTGQVPRLPFN